LIFRMLTRERLSRQFLDMDKLLVKYAL